MERSGRTERPPFQIREPALKRLLDQGVDALLIDLLQDDSARLRAFLYFSARFPQHSLYNQLLIFRQRSYATRVASQSTWQKLGYRVREGERPIRILSPRFYIREAADGGEEHLPYAVDVPVYDTSQLVDVESRPLPEPFAPLSDDKEALFSRLVHVVEEAGISVDLSERTGNAYGYRQGNRVTLRLDRDDAGRVPTLLRAYAHEVLLWSAQSMMHAANPKACHAEAAVHVVATRFGVHHPLDAHSFRAWSMTREDLLVELELVRRTVERITERLLDQAETDFPIRSWYTA